MANVGAISASVNFDVSQFIANAKKMGAEAVKSFDTIKTESDKTNKSAQNLGNSILGIGKEKSISGLTDRLSRLNKVLENSEVGSKRFIFALNEIQVTKAKIDSVKNSMESFTRGSVISIGSLNSTLAKLNSQLQNVQIGSQEFKKIQTEIKNTEKQLLSATSSSSKFGKISELAGQAGFNGMQIFSMGIKGAAVALAGLAIGKAISLGTQFEKQMSEVGAAANATGVQFKELEKKARQLGATTSFSATQAAQGMTELAKAGLNTSQVLVGTEAVLNLAKAGSLGLAEAATIAADTMAGFGLEAEDLSKISDVLAKSANSSTIGVSELGETFKYVSGVAKGAKVSMEQIAAATALLGNAGIKGSQAGTTLKSIILSLSAPSAAAEKSLSKLGLTMNSLQDKDGNLKKLPEIFKMLQDSSSKFSSTQKADIFKELFGSESLAGALSLMDSAGEKYNAMVDEMENKSTGFAKKYGDALSNNVQGKLDNLSSGMEEVFLKVWDAIKPVVSIVVSLTNSIVNIGGAILGYLLMPFKELFEFIQPAFAFVIALAEELIMEFINLDPLIIAIKESMFPLQELFREIITLGKSFWDIIMSVVNEVKTFAAILNTGDDSFFTPLVDGLKAIWEYLTEVSPLVLLIKLAFAPIVLLVNILVASIRLVVAGWKMFLDYVVIAWNKFKAVFDIISDIEKFIQKIVSGKFSLSFDIGDLTQKVLDSFNFDSIKAFFANGFVGIWDNLLAMASEFWEKFLTVTKGAVNGIKDFFKNSSPDIATQMQAFANKVEDIKKARKKPAGLGFRKMTPAGEGDKKDKPQESTDSGQSKFQPIFNRVKENVGNIADYKGTIKIFADLKSQLQDIEKSSVLFGSSFQQSLASVAVTIKAAAAVMQEFGKAFTDILAASAQLKGVKFDNFKQNLNFVAQGMSKLVDDGLKKTIDSINAETNARVKGFDDQLKALGDSKKKEEELQKEHNLAMELLKAELDAKAKAENDAKFQEQAEKLDAEYQAQIDQIAAQTSDATEAAASEEALLAQKEEAKLALRQQFDQRLIEQQDINKETIEQKNAAFDEQKKAREDKNDKDEQAIEEAKQSFLAEQENKRTQAQDVAARAKEDIQKRAALIEWQVGKGAFEANKQSQRAAIQMNMGMMVMNAAAGVLASFAQGGIVGAVIGGIMAVALTGMGLAASATSLAAVSSAQYPPPPIFADGGIVGGNSHENGGTMINAEKGEMILNQGQQAKLFDVANGKNTNAGITNIYLDSVKVQNMNNASPEMIADAVGRVIRNSTYQAVTR